MTKASIITIGDELLIGQVIDTNSAWMAQQLNKVGITVLRRVAVGDNFEQIWEALDVESTHAEIILITGGLGPTADDITKPLLCKYFDGKMVQSAEALAQVTYLFEQVFKRQITERNIRQADVPDTCKVLINTRGTAPGMWFEKNGKIFVSLPGVPHEMKGLMEEKVIPGLLEKFQTGAVIHQTAITYGLGESMLADLLVDFEQQLPANIKLAYLPNFGMVRLRLTATGTEFDITNELLSKQFEFLKKTVADFLIHDKDEPMEKIIGKELLKSGKSLATAESCTGGYLAHLLTSIPGSSNFYKGSIIAYENKVKEELLDVPNTTLQLHGAVSEETVMAMTKGLLKKIDSDYAIAVSGIMGPNGGSEDKPVGTVWIAVGDKNTITTKKFHFRFDRIKNIQLTSLNALNMLRQMIQNS